MASFYFIPSFPKTGETITFYPPPAPLKEIPSYLYDFGDGTITSGYIVTHAYEKPGTYLVSISTPSATTFALEVVVSEAETPVLNFNYVI